MKKNHHLLLGAHMSVAGGYEQALIKGNSIGCTAIQLFTKSNRQWKAKAITAQQAALFKYTAKELAINSIVSHASYLINLGNTDAELTKKSVVALIEELERCTLLGIPYLVLHPGSSGKITQEESLTHVSACLNYVLNYDSGSTMILLENTAGQGSSVGSSFEELKAIYKGVTHKKRIGFCFDTCHALVAGYDFRTPSLYTILWEQFDAIIGLEHLKVFHLNDAAKDLNSHVDRHAHIGKGKIGLEGFKLIMNDPRFFDIPKILETPKTTTDLKHDLENLEILRSLLTKKTKTALGL